MKVRRFIQSFSTIIIFTLLLCGVLSDGVQPTSAEASVASDNYNPSISVHIAQNGVVGFGWTPPPGPDVIVTIDDPTIPGSPDFTAVAVWRENYYYEVLPGDSFTIEPGQTVTMTDGITTKDIIVKPIVITNIDPVTDTVSGQTAPNTPVGVSIAPDWAIGRSAYPGEDGLWTVDFSTPEDDRYDITYGSEGQAYVADEDWDTIAVFWRVPFSDAYFAVHVNNDILQSAIWHSHNQVHAINWPLGSFVTLNLNGNAVDTQKVEVSGWDPNITFVGFDLSSFTLVPGDVVTLSMEGITKTHIITSLEVTSYNLDADTISGMAAAGTNIEINACGANICSNRNVLAGFDGNWTAVFGTAGEGQQTVDIQVGSVIEAMQFDEFGDYTANKFSVPNPQIRALLSENRVETSGWPFGATVTLTIDGEGGSYSDSQVITTGAPWDSGAGYANFDLGLDFTLAPDQEITVTDGPLTKTLTVMDLYVTSFDSVAQTVTGYADTGAWVQAGIWLDNYWPTLVVQADANTGFWQATFDQSEQPFLPWTAGDVSSWDADGDATFNRINRGHIYTWPGGDSVVIDGVAKNRNYTLIIDDPDTADPVDYDPVTLPTTDVEWDVNSGKVEFPLDGFPLDAGDVITITSDRFMRTLTVAPKGTINFDTINDIISGNNPGYSYVQVITPGSWRNVMTAPDGSWSIDYTQVDPVEDIFPGMTGGIQIDDVDGDQTGYGWNIPNPRFEVRPNIDQVRGWEWTKGETVTLTVGGQTFNTQVGETPWDPNQTYFEFNLGGLVDIEVGNTVSLTNGFVTKTTTVTALEITNVSIDTDIVSGKASPGIDLHVWACVDGGCVDRYPVVETDGTWTADFANVGAREDEEKTADIINGTWIDSSQEDSDFDTTMFSEVPNFLIVANPKANWVFGAGWPLGTELTLTVGGYSETAVAENASWDTYTAAWFDLSGKVDLVLGDVITISGGNSTKSLEITNFAITDIDVANDTLIGTGEPGRSITAVPNIPGDRRYATVGDDGTWTMQPVDGAFILTPGASGWTVEWDPDNDYITEDWNIPNPRLQVRAHWDWVEGYDWTEGETLTLEVGGETFTAVVGEDPWDPNPTAVGFDLSGIYDIKPGDAISLRNSDGTITKTTVVTDLTITDINVESDTVTGVVSTDIPIDLWICDSVSCTNRHVNPVNGLWTADFANPGSQPDEQTTYDIVNGTWIDSHQLDADGDATIFGMNVPNPSIMAHLSENFVETYGWFLNQEVTLTISGGSGEPYTAQGMTTSANWDSRTGYVKFDLGSAFNLEPGQIITVSSRSISKSYTVIDLYVDYYDPETRTVAGHSEPNVTINANSWVPGVEYKEVQAEDNDGSWQVVFDGPPDAFMPNTDGNVTGLNGIGDGTVYRINMGRIFSYPENSDMKFAYNGCNPAHLYTLVINDPSTEKEVDLLKENVPCVILQPGWTKLDVNLNDFILHAGDQITVSSGHELRTLTVSPRGTLSFDKINDIVSGTNQPDHYLSVFVAIDGVSIDKAQRIIKTGPDGKWSIDYKVPGPNGEIAVDIASSTIVYVGYDEFDAVGNTTGYGKRVRTFQLQVYPQSDLVYALGWGNDIVLKLFIADSNGQYLADFTTTVGPASWDSSLMIGDFSSTGFDFLPGQILTVIGNGYLKSYVIPNPTVFSIAVITDTISGTGTPGASIRVTSGQNFYRWTTVDATGNWMASFAPSENPADSPGAFDLVPGSSGEAYELNLYGDQTWANDWEIPFPTSGSAVGEGWFNSPAGAYAANPEVFGKASFEFAAKYAKKAGVISGEVLFTFKGFTFASKSFDWMAIEGARVQLTGTGTVNGAGSYAFMINALDSSLLDGDAAGKDAFRIRIWDNSSGAVIYDNLPGAADTIVPTEINGGSITLLK